MNWDFKSTTYGKWILAGEHAVLRGSPALVFPIESCVLNIRYHSSNNPLSLSLRGPYGDKLNLFVWGVIEEALKRVGRTRVETNGELEIESYIPIGAGLGASAALCVAITKWLSYLGSVEEESIYEFSRELENLFHGESSGVDIAVSFYGTGIKFLRNGAITPLEQIWKPIFKLSYSGQVGVTSECVYQVKKMFDNRPQLAHKLDDQMKQAVLLAEEALKEQELDLAIKKLIQSIDWGEDCFTQWGLSGGKVHDQITLLKSKGALAAKPTGSGGGGFVLSLWAEEPTDLNLQELFL